MPNINDAKQEVGRSDISHMVVIQLGGSRPIFLLNNIVSVLLTHTHTHTHTQANICISCHFLMHAQTHTHTQKYQIHTYTHAHTLKLVCTQKERPCQGVHIRPCPIVLAKDMSI